MTRRKPGYLVREALERQASMPYPGFQDFEVELLEKMLRRMWCEALASQALHKVDFAKAKEEEIPFALAVTFDTVLSVHSGKFQDFLGAFSYDAPEPKLQNFDRSSIGKKCDFTFRRAVPQPGTSRLHNAFFVEAKLVTNDHTMGYYASTGLERFLDGDYAWAMPQAMLLGYKRLTSQELPRSLEDHFRRNGGKKAQDLHLIEGPEAFVLSRGTPRMYWTLHNRDKPRPGTEVTLGKIQVFHLWLNVSGALGPLPGA